MTISFYALTIIFPTNPSTLPSFPAGCLYVSKRMGFPVGQQACQLIFKFRVIDLFRGCIMDAPQILCLEWCLERSRSTPTDTRDFRNFQPGSPSPRTLSFLHLQPEFAIQKTDSRGEV